MKQTGRIYLNDGWQFSPAFEAAMLQADFAADTMEMVRLPHTVTKMPFHYFDEQIYQMVSAYRRVIRPQEQWKGKHVFLTVEAAGHAAAVFLNGNQIAEHHCGYTAFTVDLAEHLLWDWDNVLVIRVDSRENLNQPPFGNVIDYMTYGGLYREVYLDIREKSYIRDVFAKTTGIESADGVCASAELVCEVSLENADGCTLRQELYEKTAADSEDGCGSFVCALEMAAAGSKRMVHKLEHVKLWHPDHPALYKLRTVLVKDGQILDETTAQIGLRTVEFKADGFYLNGKKFRIRGLNRHQSYPYVGYAMPASIQRQDAYVLKKELGLNAVRTSHYPQSHHFMDACDELGLLVFTEIPGWQHIGDEAWKAQAVKNTEDMVAQYRNHPSIFMWGVRINESQDDDSMYQLTNAAAHALDDTRPTGGVRCIKQSSLLEDVYTYNDFVHDGTNAGTTPRKKVTPDSQKGYIITEYNGHMFPTKSFDAEEHRTEHMRRHAEVVNSYYGRQDVAGGFGWCMADYNTHKDFGSGDRICYHGVLDMFRNPKLAAAVYASQQDMQADDQKDAVVLEVSSSMDIGEHPACLSKGVYVLTNADSVRVYKNDQLIGEYDRSSSPYKNLPHGPIYIEDFIGDLLEKGEGISHAYAADLKKILTSAKKHGMAHLPLKTILLTAKCMLFHGLKIADAVSMYTKYVTDWGTNVTVYRFEAIKDGQVVKTVEKKPVNAVKLDVKVSHTVLQEQNTYDTAAVRVRAVDESGAVLPFYQEPLFLETEGPIRIIGSSYLQLRGGMGGTYVKTTGEKGRAVLRMRSECQEPVEIVFEVI
ncbi:MAG: glycoside hydrolase family 2 protein [Lachnospiraceae bacterium]|nr:glycoside hydrolase family 2 protein [Lachnospiraceae bacterium]